MSEVSTEIIDFTHFIVFTILYKYLYYVESLFYFFTFYYAIYCTVQHHRILLYKYGAIEINKHLHLHSSYAAR